MLPGIGQRFAKANYRKCQTLGYCGGVPVPKGIDSRHLATGDDVDIHRFRPPHLVAARAFDCDRISKHMDRELAGLSPPVHPPYAKDSTAKPFIPKSVLYDRVTLRFDGYYIEDAVAWGYRRRAVHPVKVCYFLEDDTISIHEPVTPNAGRPQGRLVSRHRALKVNAGPAGQRPSEDDPEHDPAQKTAAYWHWKDLNVGYDVEIHGRQYRLIDCNASTREFLTSAGIVVNAPEDMPDSQPGYNKSEPNGQQANDGNRSRSAPTRNHQLKKFLEHDGQILRFGCIWDRRDEPNVPMDELTRPYVLRYYLVDDTIQITDAEFETNQKRGLYNTSRAQEAVLLRRQKLPREPRPVLTSPADAADLTYYDPTDLMLGNVISVLGRRFVLVEAGDDFTRQFYRSHFDVVDFTPVDIFAK